MSKTPITLALALAAAITLPGCDTTGGRQGVGTTSRSPGEDVFHTTVKPLFERRCVWCHSTREPNAGLNLQDRSAALEPKLRFIVPGDPGQSRIYRALTLESAHPGVMPGDGWGITREQESAVKNWIAEGAPWPEGRAGKIRRKPVIIEHDDYR